MTYPNYIIYLVLAIGKNVVSNAIISNKCNSIFGNSIDTVKEDSIAEYRPQIVQYVKDVFISRIGAVVYYATDNIIISVLRGSLLTGFLSNYTLITGHLTTIINQLLSSIQATYGNYINSGKTINEQKRMTDNYFCANFFVGNFCMLCFIFIVQPFIKLYFGQKMLLSFSTSLLLGINLMLTLLIQLPSQVFTIYKLFRYDRPIIIVSAILNIVISAALVKYEGINGALIGTTITSLIYLFSRFYIIAKYVYNIKYSFYIKRICFYFLVSLCSGLLISFAVHGISASSWIRLCVKGLFIIALSILVPSSILGFTQEFVCLKEKMIPKKILIVFHQKYIVFFTVIVLAICVLTGLFAFSDINHGEKSKNRSESYAIEGDVEIHLFHFSIDDTIDCFEDIASKNYISIFENPTFSWLRELHEKHGLCVSCYVYYENPNFDLSKMTDSCVVVADGVDIGNGGMVRGGQLFGQLFGRKQSGMVQTGGIGGEDSFPDQGKTRSSPADHPKYALIKI